MLSALATLLRIASRVACLVVIVSFAIFAVEQTDKASSHQQKEVIEGAPSHSDPKPARKGTVHKAIDEASDQLTSPFSGIDSGSSSRWGRRIVETVLALLVYGLGVGYLTRMLRMRV
jgi:hypothetical protein